MQKITGYDYSENRIIERQDGCDEIDIAMLGNWISTWVQPDGAIYGFHNHSVWGGNPYRWHDFTSGHTTWASPFLAGLSLALSKEMNQRGLELLRRMIRFQTNSFQKDGQYKHIGYQVGELLQWGLIHNAMSNIALAFTALYGREYLPKEDLENIKNAIIKNMEGCRMYGNGRACDDSCCNQDYARIWAKILFQLAFDDYRWEKEIFEDIDFLIDNFHVRGIPDNECEATRRSINNSDNIIVEPGEYYGLIISPLILAYEITSDKKYLEHAGALCRHIVRSSWRDDNGFIRFHRLWMRKDDEGKEWLKLDSPMLIAGMGITLYGISQYVKHVKDESFMKFLEECDKTYVYYQTPRGYFLSATGWQSEVDIVPCTAWHSHDFFYLIARKGITSDFWSKFEETYNNISVLLGDQCIWMENGMNWTIADYMFRDVYALIGRKDENRFGRDMAWVGGEHALPDSFKFPDRPVFVKAGDAIYIRDNVGKKIDIASMVKLPFKGKIK